MKLFMQENKLPEMINIQLGSEKMVSMMML